MGADRPQFGGRPGIPGAATASIGAAGLTLMVFLLSGDSGDAGHNLATPWASSSVSAGPAATPPLSRSEPVTLEIPTIDLHVNGFVRLGLQPNGEIEVPRDYGEIGWYRHGPTPGQVGPAVIGGHVDSESAPAVFHRLEELRPGDTVTIERADGDIALFTVYEVQRHAKEEFPTGRVYGPTDGNAELRLITCGGEFDASARSYRSNTIVYARLTGVQPRADVSPSNGGSSPHVR